MAELKDAMKALEALEGGKELSKAVDAAILHERETAKGLVKVENAKLKAESEKVSKLTANLTGLGFDPVAGDISEFTANIKAALDKSSQSDSKLSESQRTLKAMQDSIKQLQTSNLEFKNTIAAEKQENQNLIIKGAVSKGLQGKLLNADVHTRMILTDKKCKVGEDGKVIFADGSDFETGLAAYIEAHKEGQINSQNGGAGGGPSDGSTGQNTMKHSVFNKLSPEEQATKFQDKDFVLVE